MASRVVEHSTPAYVRPQDRPAPALLDTPAHRTPARQRVVAAHASEPAALATVAVESIAELAADAIAARPQTAPPSSRRISLDTVEPLGPLGDPQAQPAHASVVPDRPRSDSAESGRRGSRDTAAAATTASSSSTTTEATAASEQHFGVLLRHARVSQGLSLSDVADKTRISPRWLVALEEAQLDVLPAPVFVSGYLRTYARLLGLDGPQLLSRYQELARKRALALAPTERGFTVRRHGQPVQVPTWVIATLLGMVTVLVLAALWLVSTRWHR